MYINKVDIPKALTFIADNDRYFSITKLTQNPLVLKILSQIDGAAYASPSTFYARNGQLLPKECLSTGTKTLLNILQHPNCCFDVCECGDNALNMLPLLSAGNIYWRVPVTLYDGAAQCDIICKRKRFTDFYEFLNFAYDRGGDK